MRSSFRVFYLVAFFSSFYAYAETGILDAALNWASLDKGTLVPGTANDGCESGATDVPDHCPKELVSRISNDTTSDEIKKTCTARSSSTIGTSAGLEAHFESLSETRVQAGFGAKLGRCIPDQMGSGLLSLSKKQTTEDDRKALVAEYYSDRVRLKYGVQQTTSQIAAINSLLEEPNQFSSDQCTGMGSGNGGGEHCGRLNSCKPQGGLDNQVADTIYILRKVDELKFAESEAIRSGDRQKVAAINETKKVLMDQVPWANGDEFQAIIERATPDKRLDSENVRNAMKEQLRATRSRLLSQLSRYNDAAVCIRDGSSCSNFDRVIGAEAPPIMMAANSLLEKKNPSDWDRVAIDYLKGAECRTSRRHEEAEESKKKNIERGIFLASLPVGGGELMAARAGFKALLSSPTTQAVMTAAKRGFTAVEARGSAGLTNADIGGGLFSDCNESKMEADFQGAQVAADGCPKRPLAGGPKALKSIKGCALGLAMALTNKGNGGKTLGAVGRSATQLPYEKVALQKVTDPNGLEKWAEAAFRTGAEVRIKHPRVPTHGESEWTSGVMGMGKDGLQFETSYKRSGFANIHDYNEFGIKEGGFGKSVIQIADRDYYSTSEIKEKAFNISGTLRGSADNLAQLHLKGYGTVEGKVLDVSSTSIRIKTKDGVTKDLPVENVSSLLLIKYVEVYSGGR